MAWLREVANRCFERLVAVIAALLAALASTHAAAFPTATYFPLVDGYTWTYRVDGVDGFSRTVLPGTFWLNGAQTKRTQTMPGNDITYWTNDAGGIRTHGSQTLVFVPELGYVDAQLSLSPVLVHAAADAVLGGAVASSGTATAQVAGLGTYVGSYSATATPLGFESVTVPAGTFANALRIHTVSTTTFNILGELLQISSVVDSWLVENVGLVKEVAVENGVTSTVLLTGLNFGPVLTFSSLSSEWGPQPANGLSGNLYMGTLVSNNSQSTVHLGAELSGEFSLVGGADCTVLAPGEACFISVDFRPASVGPKAGTLTITSDALGSPFVHSLSGTGIPIGIATVAPGALDFGNQNRGVTSAPKSVTLANAGSAPLTITYIATTGQYSQANDCGGSLAIGASCQIQVTFTPFGAGVVNGDLIIDTINSSGERLFVRLTGNGIGVAPPASVSPGGETTFGAVQIGTTSATQSFQLKNNGTSHLNVYSIDVPLGMSLGDFAFTTNCPAVLAAGTSCAINVTFAPTASGQRYGYIYIHTDGFLSGDFMKVLSGIGAPGPVDTTPDAVTFVPKRGVPFGLRIASDPVAITGIDAETPISVSGGSYRIGNGGILETSGTVLPGQNVTAYVFAAAKPATTRQVTLRIGGMEAQFSATTAGSIGTDLGGDGRSDILWRNAVTGENYVYTMDGTAILGTEGYVRTVADTTWKVAGLGDFDGDGKADILWRNSASGENYIYFMDGTTIKPSEGYIRTVSDQNWQVAGIGDFDGDGKDDILWRNAASGENYLYPMNGLAILGTEGYLRTVADTAWQIMGVADFDGDGKADILWRNAVSGENYLYPMDGTTILGGEGYIRTVADQNWQVAGLGDFDGDGKADILWRNSSSGENYLYPMSGTAILGSEGYIRTVADQSWQVKGTGDYDGDGTADILWRNGASGENYLYPMSGTTIKPTEGYLRTVPPSDWQIQRLR